MKNLRQVFMGIVLALASIGLLLGGFLISLAEGKTAATLTPTHTMTVTSSPTRQVFTPSTDSPTPPPTLTLPPTSTWIPTLSLPPTNCPAPVGWLPYVVQYGDTLDKIAARYRISSAELQQTNCLATTELVPGVIIYLPAAPTQTPVPCGHPYTWIFYSVQPGDTLYHLSLAYGITVAELQRANCLGTSTLLHTGQLIYVPPWAPLPPLPTSILTNMPTPSLPSSTPMEASTSTATDTLIPAASDTPVEVPTDTPIPTSP
jgi:LysM repeat protein